MTVYTVTTLDDPSANGGTSANGINNVGQIVGSYTRHRRVAHHPPRVRLPLQPSGWHLYRPSTIRSRSTAASSQVPPRRASTMSARSSGITRVSSTASASGTLGFLYSGGTYTTLDDPWRARSTFAYGINNAGQIAGYYITGSGVGSVNHGFTLRRQHLHHPRRSLRGPGWHLRIRHQQRRPDRRELQRRQRRRLARLPL